ILLLVLGMVDLAIDHVQPVRRSAAVEIDRRKDRAIVGVDAADLHGSISFVFQSIVLEVVLYLAQQEQKAKRWQEGKFPVLARPADDDCPQPLKLDDAPLIELAQHDR